MSPFNAKAAQVSVVHITKSLFMIVSCRVGDHVRRVVPGFKWDYKDLFFAVATRVGSSDNLHTDWGDCRRGGIAFVLTLSKWKGGGDLEFPQLGISVRPVPGDVAFMQAGRLLHRATMPEEGERVVITLFTDNNLFADALRGER